MRPESFGLNGETNVAPAARVVVRVGLALLVGCALVVSGISGPTNAPRGMADMLPSPESSREYPAEESNEEESSESETILGSKRATRRLVGSAGCSPRPSTLNIEPHKSGFSFLSQPAAPAGELAHRNGVGALLRC